MSGGTDPFHVCPCFLPVNLSFIAAFAALKVSLWRRMSGKRRIHHFFAHESRIHAIML